MGQNRGGLQASWWKMAGEMLVVKENGGWDWRSGLETVVGGRGGSG